MVKFRKIEPIVLECLENNLETRIDDFILVYQVYKRYLTGLCFDAYTFKDVIENHKTLKLPSFESITRCRRKLQELHPDLASEKTKNKRPPDLSRDLSNRNYSTHRPSYFNELFKSAYSNISGINCCWGFGQRAYILDKVWSTRSKKYFLLFGYLPSYCLDFFCFGCHSSLLQSRQSHYTGPRHLYNVDLS